MFGSINTGVLLIYNTGVIEIEAIMNIQINTMTGIVRPAHFLIRRFDGPRY